MSKLWTPIKLFFKDHWLIIAMTYSSCFLIFFIVYSLNKSFNNYLLNYTELIDFLKTIAILTFTSGIFASALKYIQYLKIFEKEFERIILSPKFENKLKETLHAITFHEDFLTNQNDIDAIWKKVTLIKYKKEFPELYSKIERNLTNELFEANNLSKYYKNVIISYELELEENSIIKVKENSSFTIVRSNKDSFLWDFFVTLYNDDTNKTDSPDDNHANILNYEKTRIDGETIDETKCKFIESVEDESFIKKKYSYTLSGKHEYNIERHFRFSQNLNNDRLISFNSSHVIDDLSVFIKKCDKLEVVFDSIGKNTFDKSDIFSDENRISYTNRDAFLPGEKYKLFVYKKDLT